MSQRQQVLNLLAKTKARIANGEKVPAATSHISRGRRVQDCALERTVNNCETWLRLNPES